MNRPSMPLSKPSRDLCLRLPLIMPPYSDKLDEAVNKLNYFNGKRLIIRIGIIRRIIITISVVYLF